MKRDDEHHGQGGQDTGGDDASSEERARAQTFARHLDAMLAGGPHPPALEAEARDLLELATVLHASLGEARLDDRRQARLLDAAFTAARAATPDAGTALTGDERPLPHRAPELRQAGGRPLTLANRAGQRGSRGAHLTARRDGVRRAAPWIVAAASLAAAFALALRLERAEERAGGVTTSAQAPVAISATARSRSADALIGPIARGDASEARARIDTVFADRMAGYRAVRLARGGSR